MTGDRLKVLHITDTLGMGGAETWMMALLRLWSKQGGPRCDFLMTSGNRGIFDSEAESLGARLHYLPFTRRTLPGFVLGFRSLLRRERYDAIHDHQAYISGWHFLIAGGLLPRVAVAHVHNPSYQITEDYGVSWPRQAAGKLGRTLVSRLATAVVGTSQEALNEHGFARADFPSLAKAPLYCGFSPEIFLGDRAAACARLRGEFGWPQDARIILFAGRMDRSPDVGHKQNHKNSGFAVDVVIAAIARDPKVRVLFAGITTAALPVLERRLAAAGVRDHVVFAGIRNDMPRLMLAADALLFPSRAEGLGMVAVEAQSSGLPVLASTAVPRECVVLPGLVRFLPVENNVPLWVDNLLALMALPRDMESANQAVKASPFAIRNSARSLEMLYRTGLPPGNIDNA